MLNLILLRHAKSSWDEPLDDYERPLSERGMQAAPRMGAALAALNVKPGLIICSGAARARETLHLVVDQLGPALPEIIYDDALYMASADVLLRRLRALGQHAVAAAPPVVMLVGHNPGLEELALDLVGSGPTEARARMSAKFPTAGLAVIAFAADNWAGIEPGTGRLQQFLTPQLLP
jgi:phosphohistidine phosphatase